jgi:hypothetical protein
MLKIFRKKFSNLNSTITCLIFALILNGCAAAAVPVYMMAAGAAAGFVGLTAINSVKEQHPEVDFSKERPQTESYPEKYETVYDAVIKSIMLLNEEIEMSDKSSGVINTKKAIFGKEPSVVGYATGKKVFYQRKNILIKKASGQTQVTLIVKFSDKGSYTSEGEFSDENAENAVRNVFFDKLESVLNES